MEDKQPTEQQIKEFWEWCGLKQICSPHDDMYRRGIWADPIEQRRFDTPDIDLNNLFKYAVPKLYAVEVGTWFPPDSSKLDWRAWVEDSPMSIGVQSYGETPALALFWAIWEVIHK